MPPAQNVPREQAISMEITNLSWPILPSLIPPWRRSLKVLHTILYEKDLPEMNGGRPMWTRMKMKLTCLPSCCPLVKRGKDLWEGFSTTFLGLKSKTICGWDQAFYKFWEDWHMWCNLSPPTCEKWMWMYRPLLLESTMDVAECEPSWVRDGSGCSHVGKPLWVYIKIASLCKLSMSLDMNYLRGVIKYIQYCIYWSWLAITQGDKLAQSTDASERG